MRVRAVSESDVTFSDISTFDISNFVIFLCWIKIRLMKTPFVFGRLAKDNNFTDRIEETAHLVQNFKSLINTILISPRRWGKSSLVFKAAGIAMREDGDLRVCRVDLFNVRSEEQFYTALAQSVIKSTATKWEDAVSSVTRFLSRFVPKVSFGGDPMGEITVELNMEELRRSPDEILDLAEKIAAEKKLRIVVCIDEFQNIATFDASLAFQKKLRSHFQQHENVAYCLYGSKRHMMMEVFTDYSMPFYKFGDIMFLEKIKTPDWVEFIKGTFERTGKSIGDDICEEIVTRVENHPYYVQQLAQQVWLRTDKVAKMEAVDEAHSTIVAQLSLMFGTMTQALTNQQMCLMRAMSAGEKNLSSRAVMEKYGLSSPTVISRARKALVEKDILDDIAGVYSFQDPVYAYWLKHQYFLLK